MKIAKGCRMSCEKFERVFVPSFRNFCFNRAFKIAEKLLNSQSLDRTTTHLVRAYNQMQMIKKQPVKIKSYIAQNLHATRVECVISDLIAISRNPTEYQTPCCDAGIDVFIHQNMVYAVPLSVFVKEYKTPKSIEDFSYSDESMGPDWSLRKETWQKLYSVGRMRLEIINASKNLGLNEIKNKLLSVTNTQELKSEFQNNPESPDSSAHLC